MCSVEGNISLAPHNLHQSSVRVRMHVRLRAFELTVFVWTRPEVLLVDKSSFCIVKIAIFFFRTQVPAAAVEDSEARLSKAPWWHSPTSMLFGGWAKNDFERVQSAGGQVSFVYNGLSGVQGPNYALAKTLQVGRFIFSRSKAEPKQRTVFSL